MQDTDYNIAMTAEGVNAVLNALGKMPTESNLWPLFNDIRRQAMEQAKQKEAAKAEGSQS